MDDFYLLGCWIAFLVGFVKVCIAAAHILSIRARNLKKIGMHYSLINGSFTSTTRTSFARFAGFVVYMLLLAPIFSWLSVASSAWGLIAWLSNRTSIPEAVKAIQYKIAHVHLSKEQLIELQEELSKILGVDGPVRIGAANEGDEDYNYSKNVLEFEYGRLTVDPANKIMKFYSHTPDHHGSYYSTYEYKFAGDRLQARLVEDRNDWLGKKEWEVKDGVVLESEIRERDAQDPHRDIAFEPLDDRIATLKAKTEWHEYSSYEVRFFVMKNHPDLFSFKDLRRLIRAEVERIKSASRTIRAEVQQMGLEVSETDEGIKCRYPEGFPAEKKPMVENFFSDESFKKFGLTVGQLGSIKKIQTELLKLLGEDAA